MIPLLVLAVVTPLFVAATPTPTPSPALPEIGRVRSNAMCSTLHDTIAPTVIGLMKNDEIIGAGHRAFAKMARDSAGTSTAAIDIDSLYLEQIETRLVHNLKIMDTALADQKRFPTSPRSADERDAVAMKNQLLAVVAEQRKALDLVSGTLETESLGQMQHELDTQMQSATGQASAPQTAATAGPTSFIGTAGLPEYTPVAGLPTTASKTSTLAGHTVYDSINAALEVTQGTIAGRERVATAAVLNAVDDCRASLPAAHPTSMPSP